MNIRTQNTERTHTHTHVLNHALIRIYVFKYFSMLRFCVVVIVVAPIQFIQPFNSVDN